MWNRAMGTTLSIGLVSAVLAGLIASGAIKLSPWQEVEGGGIPQVNKPSLVEVIEVDSLEHLHQHETPAPSPEEEFSFELKSVDELTHKMDVVYGPSHVPKGFALGGVRMRHGHAIETLYLRDDLELTIVQDSEAAQPRVKRGYVDVVSVNGHPAYLIRGAWHRVIKDGSVSDPEWDPDIMLSVIFQIDYHWFLVETEGDFSEAQLMRVAESIRPVKWPMK